MKKIIILSPLVAFSLFSADIKFNLALENPQHIMPSSASEVLSYNRAIKSAVTSVVNISTKQNNKITKNFKSSNFPFPREFMEPLFRYQPKPAPQKTLGSGVILSKDGYIITNSHVIRGADEIKVTLPHTKQEFNAKVVGIDEDSDLAVIKVEATSLPAIELASSSSLLVGDVVFAIGNPFGVGESVTSGIISALNKNKVGLNQYENFIQTDASINPGNSGGALVDSRGALIGINSAIISKSGGNDGIGLAIPIDMVKDITKKLIKDGKVSRGYIGVTIGDVTKNLHSIYNHKKGAVILDIEPNSPAVNYGLKRGDLIYGIDTKEINDANTLKQIIGSYQPDQKITMKLERNKKEITITATLSSRDSKLTLGEGIDSLAGLNISNLTNEIRYTYRIPRDVKGALIKDIKPNSEAEKVGLQAGDVIIQIEDKNIKNIKDVYKVFKKYYNKPKRVYINRYGTILMFVTK